MPPPETRRLAETTDIASEKDISIIIERALPTLQNVLRHYDIPLEERDDILQDTYLVFIKSASRIRDPYKWLIGTVYKKCIRYWRKHRKGLKETSEVPVDPEILALQPDSTVPQEIWGIRRDLAKVLRALTPKQREILIRSFWLGQSTTEIASAMGYHRASIRKAKNRTLTHARVKAVLVNSGEGEKEKVTKEREREIKAKKGPNSTVRKTYYLRVIKELSWTTTTRIMSESVATLGRRVRSMEKYLFQLSAGERQDFLAELEQEFEEELET